MFNGNYFPAAYFPEGWGDHEGGSPIANISCVIHCVSSFMGGLIAEGALPIQEFAGAGGAAAYYKAKKKRLKKREEIYASWVKPQTTTTQAVVNSNAREITRLASRLASNTYTPLLEKITAFSLPASFRSVEPAPVIDVEKTAIRLISRKSKHDDIFPSGNLLANEDPFITNSSDPLHPPEEEWDYNELLMMVEYLEAV